MGRRQCLPRDQLNTVLFFGFCRVGQWIVHAHVTAVILQFADDIFHTGVAQIRTVLLEGEAEHRHPGACHRMAAAHQLLDGLFGNELAHTVVGLAPAKHHLRMIACTFRLVGQVVGVDTDAVTSHQAGPEWQEIPLGARRLQHIQRIDTQLVENHRQLVHQGNVKVALGILDDLGRLCHLHAGGAMHTHFHHRLVELGHTLQRCGCVAGDHFGDGFQAVHLVTRVDALGGIPDKETTVARHILPAAPRPGQARSRLQ